MQREPLHVQFVRIAKQHPHKAAFVDRGLQRRYTYRRALAASLVLADTLKGIDDSLVGVMLPTSAGAAIVVLALLMSGKIPVLLNYSTGVTRNVEYARQKCGFAAVITAQGFLAKLDAPELDGFVYIEHLLRGMSVIDKGRAALRAGLSAERILSRYPEADIDATAAILFTTGTEGEPKAVPLTHRNIIANLEALSQIYPFRRDDVMLATLPFFHVFGLAINLWLPLRFGMTIVTYVNPTDYKTICTIIREDGPTYLVGTPSFLQGYLHHSQPGDFKSLQLIVTGADKCPEVLRGAYLAKHGVTVYEGYGTTETSPIISVNTPDRYRHGSAGWVLPNLALRIVQRNADRECAIGETGRILVRGESVFGGYLNDRESTGRSLRGGWFDTGDMGYIDADGFLWHVGRLQRCVKVGGEMVSLIHVEEVLNNLLPMGASCCVVGSPDATKGTRIVAAVTRPIDERRMYREMARHLPTIALPKRFVVLEDLPRMASGKMDVQRITERVRELMKTH